MHYKYHKSRILGFLTLTFGNSHLPFTAHPWRDFSKRGYKKMGFLSSLPKFFVARRFITRHQMHTPKRNPFSYTVARFTLISWGQNRWLADTFEGRWMYRVLINQYVGTVSQQLFNWYLEEDPETFWDGRFSGGELPNFRGVIIWTVIIWSQAFRYTSLRILDPPMEGWTNLYDAGLGSSKWRQFWGSNDP